MMLAALAAAGCLAVAPASDQIMLRDLAPAFPDAASLSADTPVALAPAPGVERRFDLAELRRLAARLALPDPVAEACVTRPAAPLDPARLLEALRAALPSGRIELLDYSRFPVPEGALEFPLAGLRGSLWSGSIRYGGGHRVPIWARVTAAVATVRVVAAHDIKAGVPIEAAALRVETRDEPPSAEAMTPSVDAVAGMIAKRPIREGEAIRAAWLDAPKAVTRGDTVEVEVREGGALLRLPAQALASGAIGQTILVLNPESKRRFPARVEARGKVGVGKASL
jgi:flagella basal body P-ring formation protein FlgA